MADSTGALPPSLVDAAFPFHLVLDRDLCVRRTGSSIRKLLGDIDAHTPLTDVFTLIAPAVACSFEAFASQPRALFLLSSTETPSLVLRGQMLHDVEADCLFFVGSPWVTQTASFADLGLTLDDFAVSDGVVDYVLLLQNQAASLNDARQLAAKLRETAEQLTHQAFHDALTGLPNRAMLLRHLEDTVRIDTEGAPRSTGSAVAVLMVDLDGFKAVNDSYGHAAGDSVLGIVAGRLRGVAGPSMVARFGGDEFSLVVEADRPGGVLDEAMVLETAKRVLATLAEPISLPQAPTIAVPLTASVGIAYGSGAEQGGDLLRNADLAMYAAKASGKSRHEFYVPAMHAKSVSRLDLANQLHTALDRGELHLMFQPLLRLNGDRFAGAEALLRWQHPTRGLLGPQSFIQIAEETGLIVPIGAWVLDEACRELRLWQSAHTGAQPLGVAVNLSGRQFGPDLVDTVAAAIAYHDIDPSMLTLEITEGLIAGEGPRAQETVRALKQLGVWLAIDDFGTGHSSLVRLRDYEFDELKIDRRFVGDLDAGGTTLVAAQIAMAHGLGMSVVAEGVETRNQLDYLRSQRCGQVQGYFVARPLPADDVRSLLAGPGEWHDGGVRATLQFA